MKYLVLCLTLMLAGCFEEGAQQKLEGLGYKDIVAVQEVYFFPRAWKCGKGNKFEYEARNPKGEKVHGVVCYPSVFDIAWEEKVD